ncbi:hypothetical protein, partial [Mesorhizobium sanjuanii]|uniref:hypothetical protein n=1 Tax=Mesorhizobium sanjuanii TaxID=2037900 RepID=UPI001AD84350
FVWGTIRNGLGGRRQDFEQALPIIREHLSRIANTPAPKERKGRHEQIHINHAVATLSRMWSEIGGKAIDRNPDVVGKGAAMEFVQLGPRFVLDMMASIDPSVELKHVRSALRRVPVKAKGPTENMPTSGEIL